MYGEPPYNPVKDVLAVVAWVLGIVGSMLGVGIYLTEKGEARVRAINERKWTWMEDHGCVRTSYTNSCYPEAIYTCRDDPKPYIWSDIPQKEK